MHGVNFLGTYGGLFARCHLLGDVIETPPFVSWLITDEDFLRSLVGHIFLVYRTDIHHPHTPWRCTDRPHKILT